MEFHAFSTLAVAILNAELCTTATCIYNNTTNYKHKTCTGDADVHVLCSSSSLLVVTGAAATTVGVRTVVGPPGDWRRGR